MIGRLIPCYRSLTFAAMDTTSSALSRILSLLAEHPDVQDKLRAELIEAKKSNGDEELGYDQLVSLPYLDAVCRESLRVWVPGHCPFMTEHMVDLRYRYPPLSTTLRMQVF